MRLTLDTDAQTLQIELPGGVKREMPLYSRESFEILSLQWLKMCWNEKYVYTFSWLGRPIIQLPDDLMRIQEVIYRIKPDVIVETGVAHGGSLIFYASLCKAMEKGRIIGVDIEIRPRNREAIEAHELFSCITLIEGSSTADEIVGEVRGRIRDRETVLVILDSNHIKSHVLAELEVYAPLVTKGSYVVVTDGFMRDLTDVPRGNAAWKLDNPTAAAEDFILRYPDFVIEQPAWLFNESELRENVTHWPSAYLRRK